MTSEGAPPPQVVRVKREFLAACMTCPLCHKLLCEATTISECLHTFCRKCIFEKLSDEEVDCCPICNIDLGCVALEKLRPDHSLQDVRAKIFPFKRRKVNAPEVPSVPLPVRRKERSLSSLVVNTPRVATQSGLTGRRTKAVARRAATSRGLSTSIDESIKKDDVSVEDHAESSSSHETLSKFAKKRKQSLLKLGDSTQLGWDSGRLDHRLGLNSSNVEPSNKMPTNSLENGESYGDKAELWKPLNCLVEAANRTKFPKLNQQSPVTKAEKINGPDTKVHIPKTKVREHPNKSIVQDDKNGSVLTSPVLAKAKRLHGISRKRKQLGTSAQALLDAAGGKHERRSGPIWFSLVATADQHMDARLPQLSADYLRIKDGTLPASTIQKYLVKKLDLANETEVAINCRGEPVDPTMPLHGLVEMWLRAGSSQKAHASVGSSAKDFVMVLTYCRRAPAL